MTGLAITVKWFRHDSRQILTCLLTRLDMTESLRSRLLISTKGCISRLHENLSLGLDWAWQDSRPGEGNLRPAGCIRPTKHFYQALKEFIIQWVLLIMSKLKLSWQNSKNTQFFLSYNQKFVNASMFPLFNQMFWMLAQNICWLYIIIMWPASITKM